MIIEAEVSALWHCFIIVLFLIFVEIGKDLS